MAGITGLISSRLSNLVMAIGLVMIYFFIDSLTVNMDQSLLKIDGKEDFHPVEAHEISPVQILETNPISNDLEVQVITSEIQEDVVEFQVQEDQGEPQGFYTPKQEERPNLLTPVGDQSSLAEIPLRLVVPAIQLDAPILGVQPEMVKIGGAELMQWLSPDEYAAGWHETSARLGEPGNTVLNGHHNTSGEVFKRLVDLMEGDLIKVYSDSHLFTYLITNKMILPEKYETLDVRIKNAQWILPSQDERLTLITCWPYESNTHRLIIVAKPISVEAIPDIDQELLPRLYDENSSFKDEH
jgi:LPXTG-site transpeptidase (sortase) family protein